MTSPVAPVPHVPERLRRRAEFGSLLITEAWHPGATSIPAHHHATATLTFVLNGGFAESMDGSPRETDVTGLLYRPAMVTHRDRIGPAGVLTLGVALGVTASFGGLEWQRLLPAPCCAPHPDMRRMAGRLRREVGNRDDLSALAVEATVAELMLGLCRQRRRGGERGRVPQWLVRAAEAVNERYRESDLSLSKLALDVGVRPATLARGFRRRFGYSLGTALRRRRLDAALELIDRRAMPIARAAADSGFFDQSHLTRVCRTLLGVTPAAWRGSRAEAWRAGRPGGLRSQ
ncbi:MAG: helix-turn-helix transcriptional regulator [Gemmatimonadales bacterium]